MLPAILRCSRSAPLARCGPAARFASRMDHGRPVEGAITAKLTAALHPEHLEVRNESHMHAVPPGSESHFRVLVVSERFRGLSLLQRHRLVNEALKAELSTRVHALAIQAKTPEQWGADPHLAESPPCLGGSRGDHSVEDKLKTER
ncbi:bolA-like protein 1 [Vanacampus margaritifer]